MFGASTIPVPNQQEIIPTNPITTDDNHDEPIPDTIQYQLPSTENISQHRQHLIE